MDVPRKGCPASPRTEPLGHLPMLGIPPGPRDTGCGPLLGPPGATPFFAKGLPVCSPPPTHGGTGRTREILDSESLFIDHHQEGFTHDEISPNLAGGPGRPAGAPTVLLPRQRAAGSAQAHRPGAAG